MKNQETITEFKNAYASLVATRPVPEKMVFEVEDLTLTKQHFLQLDGLNLSEKATRQILDILKVKPDFPVIADEIGDSDFNVILGLLKTARSDNQLVATISYTNTGKDVVPMIQRIYINRNAETQEVIRTDNTAEAVSKALGESPIDYRFGDSLVDSNNRLSFSFIADEEPVDVFNAGFDTWSVGYEVSFNENSFDIYPVYERLVCSNGMKSITRRKNTNISKNKFNEEEIYKITRRKMKSTDRITKHLIEQTNLLKTTTLSLDELRWANRHVKSLLMSTGFKEEVKTETKEMITDSFDLSKYDELYHCDVQKKSRRWLSTANSGVNAYDMLNQITNIATHLVVAETVTPIELNMLASEIFFMDKFDLSQVAGFAEIPVMKNTLME